LPLYLDSNGRRKPAQHGRYMCAALQRKVDQHRRRVRAIPVNLIFPARANSITKPVTARARFLAVPLLNHENDVVGVLQLINARDANTNGEISCFF
jgi:hypothetical protein